jgi:hypothetical protein
MNYSYYHKAFTNRLNYHYDINKQDVLDHPENYLGPNYKELLNFWFYWDSLSDEKKNVFNGRLLEIEDEAWRKARALAKKLAKEVIDPRFVDFYNVLDCEIIAAHLYLERNIPFTILPLLFDL